ncbi:MAG: cytochrome c [Anaerolineales bacterium]
MPMRKRLFWSSALLLFGVLIVLIARPRWYLNLIKRVEVSPAVGAALVEQYGCRKCHIIGGQGALYAPNLDRSMKYLSDEELFAWLRNPRAVRPSTAMPNLHLSDSEIQAIREYLRGLQNGEGAR